MKSAVAASSAGFVGRPASRRVIPRNARIIGRAEGNIIATIMTTRSAKKRTRSVDRNREGAVSAIRASVEVHVAYQAAPTTRATAAATGTVRCRSSQAGSAATVSTMPRWEGGRADMNVRNRATGTPSVLGLSSREPIRNLGQVGSIDADEMEF